MAHTGAWQSNLSKLVPCRHYNLANHRCLDMQVSEEALDVLLEYQQQMERVKSDRKHKFALARTFVLPGRCGPALLPTRARTNIRPVRSSEHPECVSTLTAVRRIMYLRKVREGVRAKTSNMEPVWITCDDLNNEGILVRGASDGGHRFLGVPASL